VPPVPIVDFGQAVAADADVQSITQHHPPGRLREQRPVGRQAGPQVNARSRCTLSSVLDQGGDQVGFQKRFTAEETQFERSAGCERTDRSVNRNPPHFMADRLRELRPGVTVIAPQVTLVRDHEYEMEAIVLHSVAGFPARTIGPLIRPSTELSARDKT
jgi:hypothetical protein